MQFQESVALSGSESVAFDAFCRRYHYQLDDPDALREWGAYREAMAEGIDPDASWPDDYDRD